ncbi:exported protein [Pigmentiphaga litoralis]|uniref:Bug family tripartite tricarboxylate transporter substrate binding protein n=1 Tax=Pigmentiphaga litoralis TaxID=516702 RepID=UPI00167A6CCB|nr:tripartite tricarboxylate transporter substrate binding protein [Pigmentiphaga litoralis]GGX19369.1 exported protein [Pigmentiphaga litoralis]
MMMPKVLASASRRCITAIAACLLTCSASFAQEFPTRTVRLIVPYVPGNGADIVARIVAEQLGKIWGHAVTVDNKPGASGIVAMQEAKNSPADGYHLVLGDVGTLAINPHLYRTLPYNPTKDFTIVTDLLTTPWGFFVPRSGSIQTLEDLVKAAKAQPGKLTYGTSGKGAPNSMAIGLLKLRLGINMLEVPYKKTSEVYTGIAAGRLDLMAGSMATIDAYKDRMTTVALAADERSQHFREVPTLSEASGIPDFTVTAWAMLVTRSTVPPAIVQKIRADVMRVFELPEVKTRIEQLGMKGGGKQDVKTLNQFVADEAQRYGAVVSAEKLEMQ